MECAVGGGPQQALCVRSRDAALPLYVQCGVTSMVSTGDQLPAQRFLQRMSDAEPAKYPRIFMGSPFIEGHAQGMRVVGPGRIADLVLLDADPLERITNTSRISAVLRAGRQTTRV